MAHATDDRVASTRGMMRPLLSLLPLAVLAAGCETVHQVHVRDPRGVEVEVAGKPVDSRPGVTVVPFEGGDELRIERREDGTLSVGHVDRVLVTASGDLPVERGPASRAWSSHAQAFASLPIVVSQTSSTYGDVTVTTTKIADVRLRTPWSNVARVDEYEPHSILADLALVVVGGAAVAASFTRGSPLDENAWPRRGFLLGGGFLGAFAVVDLLRPWPRSWVAPNPTTSVEDLRFGPDARARFHAERVRSWGHTPFVLGLSAMVLGAVFAFDAIDAREHARAACTNGYCRPDGMAAAVDAQRSAAWSERAFGLGAALTTLGLVGLFWKTTTDSNVKVTVAEAADRGGLRCIVSF